MRPKSGKSLKNTHQTARLAPKRFFAKNGFSTSDFSSCGDLWVYRGSLFCSKSNIVSKNGIKKDPGGSQNALEAVLIKTAKFLPGFVGIVSFLKNRFLKSVFSTHSYESQNLE